MTNKKLPHKGSSIVLCLAVVAVSVLCGVASARSEPNTVHFQIPDRFDDFRLGVTVYEQVLAAYGPPTKTDSNDEAGVASAAWDGIQIHYRQQEPHIVYNVSFEGQQKEADGLGIGIGDAAVDARNSLVERFGRPKRQTGVQALEKDPNGSASFTWRLDVPSKNGEAREARTRYLMASFSEGRLQKISMGGPFRPYGEDERSQFEQWIQERKIGADNWRNRIAGTIWKTVPAPPSALVTRKMDRYEEGTFDYHWFGPEGRCIQFEGIIEDLMSLQRRECGQWYFDHDGAIASVDSRGKEIFSAYFTSPEHLLGVYAFAYNGAAWMAQPLPGPLSHDLEAYLKSKYSPSKSAFLVYNYESGVMTWSEFLDKWSSRTPEVLNPGILSAHGSVSGRIKVQLGTFYPIDGEYELFRKYSFVQRHRNTLFADEGISYWAFYAKGGSKVAASKQADECLLIFEAGLLVENSCAWFGQGAEVQRED